jgi:hypothetical protein
MININYYEGLIYLSKLGSFIETAKLKSTIFIDYKFYCFIFAKNQVSKCICTINYHPNKDTLHPIAKNYRKKRC